MMRDWSGMSQKKLLLEQLIFCRLKPLMSSLQLLNWWCPFPVEVNDQLKKEAQKCLRKCSLEVVYVLAKHYFIIERGLFVLCGPWLLVLGVYQIYEKISAVIRAVFRVHKPWVVKFFWFWYVARVLKQNWLIEVFEITGRGLKHPSCHHPISKTISFMGNGCGAPCIR